MTDTVHKTSVPPTKRSLPVRIARFASFSLLGIVVFLAVLIGFTETRYFKDLARDFIVETADSAFTASLEIGSLDGNLFSGWRLDDVRLARGSQPIVEIASVTVRYNLFRLPWKVVVLKELTITSPRITITKANGKDWNIAGLLRDTTEAEPAGEFDWRIVVENLRILDGSFVIRDSAVTGPFLRTELNPSNMDFNELNIALRADITSQYVRFAINQLSFENRVGDLSVRNVSGDLLFTKTSSMVERLSVQTDRSAILLTAHVDSLDLFKSFTFEEFAARPLALAFEAPNVETADLQYFLPELYFLGTAPSLHLQVKGTLQELDIERLQLKTLGTDITFTGNVRHIDKGGDLFIDVIAENATIDGRDLPLVLPGISLPDYSELGVCRFRMLKYRGRPLSFTADIDMDSDAGGITGSAMLDIAGAHMIYDADFATRQLDLSKLFRSPSLASSLTAKAKVKGQGTALGSIAADLSIEADSSRFQRYFADTFNCTAIVTRDSLHFDIRTVLGASNLEAEGGMSFGRDTVTGVSLRAIGRGIDLAKITDNDSLRSVLNFELDAETNSLSLKELSGRINLTLEDSEFDSVPIDRDTLRVVLDQRHRMDRRFHVASQYADVTISGLFDLPRFIHYLSVQGDSVARGLKDFDLASDSARTSPKRLDRSTHLRQRQEWDRDPFMDAQYSITLKKPEQLAKFLRGSTLVARGNLSGTIEGGFTGTEFTGAVAFDELYYADTTLVAFGERVECRYQFRNLSPYNTFRRLIATLDFQAGALTVNNLHLNDISVGLQYDSLSVEVEVEARKDTTAGLRLAGSVFLGDERFTGSFPVCNLFYLRQSWIADQPVEISLQPDGVECRSLRLRNENALVTISGRRFFEGKNSFTVRAERIPMAQIEYYATQDPQAFLHGFGGTADIEASLGGTDEEPLLALDGYVTNLQYDGARFGNFTIESRYNNRSVELYSELDYPEASQTRKVFFASGSIPMSLSFTGSTDTTLRGTPNLRVQMKEFPLTLLEKFLGLFAPFNGTANADVTIEGTAQQPRYTGFLETRNARGRFLFNNMYYSLSLRLEPQETKVVVRDCSIRNESEDWKSGSMEATGSIAMDGFRLGVFDINLKGQLKILRRASRAVIKTMYGDLFIASGEKGLHYYGRLDSSLFSGDLRLVEGNLVLPQETQTDYVREYSNITYAELDDLPREERKEEQSLRELVNARNGDMDESVPLEKPRRSFLDGLSYDLNVRTEGILRIVMPFSSLAQEELNARLIIDALKVEKQQGAAKFIGEVELGPDSYYEQFGKRFTASGKLRFIRDPENPDLDLKAVYSDYHIDPKTNERRRVYVIIYIAGTRQRPLVAWDMRWDSPDSQQRPRAGDVQSDALSFILVGLFTDEISGSSEKGRLLSQADAIGNALYSSLLSTTASEFVNKMGLQSVIKRVEVGGLGTQDARVRVTSEVGQAIVTYDGRINNLTSSDITLEFPMSMFFPAFGFGNMVIQMSRKTKDYGVEVGSGAQETAVLELKLLYRFSF